MLRPIHYASALIAVLVIVALKIGGSTIVITATNISIVIEPGPATAIIIAAVIFILMHIDPVTFVSALPLGIYLCIMYQRLGSIVPGIVLHMLWNAFATFVV